MTFRVGQKVVCVDASPGAGYEWAETERPVEGRVYTVRSVHEYEGSLVCWLVEIRRNLAAVFQHGPMVGYGVFRFRAAVEPLTDISELREIVAGVFRKAKVGV